MSDKSDSPKSNDAQEASAQRTPSIIDGAFWVDEPEVRLLAKAARVALSHSYKPRLTQDETDRLITLCARLT